MRGVKWQRKRNQEDLKSLQKKEKDKYRAQELVSEGFKFTKQLHFYYY